MLCLHPLFNVTPIQGGKSLQLLTPTERTVAYITELRRDDNFLQCHTIQKDFFANLRESWREPYPVSGDAVGKCRREEAVISVLMRLCEG